MEIKKRRCNPRLTWSGTDISNYQGLLGDESPKTTQIYTHITTKGFDELTRLLDTLDLQLS